ncbi:MAG TPA: hypothetical protein VK047_04505 [Zeimonas sp.]|nr:hypothetical protein [Zeimonas sp.]
MSPALHAVARLIDCPSSREGLAASLSAALADETRLPIATRLRLVALAARLEAGEDCGCAHEGSTPPEWIASLTAALLHEDEAAAMDALVANAAHLRTVAARAGRRACRLPAIALLELLERRLH